MNYSFVALTFLISVIIAWIIIPRILLISIKKKLFDEPNERKIHKFVVPRLGGVSFFPTILFAVCCVFAFRYLFGYEVKAIIAEYILPEMLLFICGLTLLYVIGIADDLVGVRYHKKFFIQLLCAVFFPISGLWINNLYGLLGVYEISAWIGMPLTVLTVIFITNAINLIDGIDGLASGLSSVALIVFGYLFLLNELYTYSMIAFASLGVLIPFFYFNVFGNATVGRKIFMGDTGSLTLGYILSFLAIRYSQFNPDIMPYTQGAVVIAFSTLLVPALDVVRVVLLRARKGKALFMPDKNHIHHKFLDMGFSPRRAMLAILFISCAFSLYNIIMVHYMNISLLFVTDLVAWIGMHCWWDLVRDKKLYKLESLEEYTSDSSVEQIYRKTV